MTQQDATTNNEVQFPFEVTKVEGGIHDAESFHLPGCSWDVKKLWSAVKMDREVNHFPIQGSLDMIGSLFGVGLSSRIEGMTGEEYAMSDNVDYTVPCLIVQWKPAHENGKGSSLVVDGWSRIYKAGQEGITELPCYYFTAEEVDDLHAIDDAISENHNRMLANKKMIAQAVITLLEEWDAYGGDTQRIVKRMTGIEVGGMEADPYDPDVQALDDLSYFITEWGNGKDLDVKEDESE